MGSDRLFGTDGIRGVAGEFPLDRQTVRLIGLSLTRNLADELGRRPSIVIGRDTRESGPAIEQALAEGALSGGGHIESAGVITTPGVAFLTRTTPFDAGVVISASHNPYHDNGIKVFSPSGKKLADEMERKIEADIALFDDRRERQPGASGASEESPPQEVGGRQAQYRHRYVEYLVREVAEGVRLDRMRIGIDCSNGAACAIAPTVFERLGAQVMVLSAEPDGRNINEQCGSLYPQRLQQAVVEHGLDLGFAFDGDADRLLAVDEDGSLVDGDHALLILADYLRSKGRLAGDVVVGTVMSNLGLEVAMRERGITLVRANVGDRYVLEELLARGASLGGEQSGHIMFPEISLAGDGIITGIELLRAVLSTKRSLGGLASQLTKYPQVLVNAPVSSKPPLESLPSVQSVIARLEEEMQGKGRLLVRYSGTENLARVMIEGEDQQRIEQQANRLAEAIRQAIG